MAWLLVLGTIPVGIVGLVFEHSLRTVFAKPPAAAIFLTLNGVILLAGERLRRRSETRELVQEHAHHTDPGNDVGRDLDTLELREGAFIGSAQILALFAGISRSGVTMVAGLLRGLDHEDAARFSFMLATPVIFAAGVYKLPDLLGHNGDRIRGQVLVGSIAAGIAAYIAGAVPHPLLRDPHADAVRDLQPRVRHRDDLLHHALVAFSPYMFEILAEFRLDRVSVNRLYESNHRLAHARIVPVAVPLRHRSDHQHRGDRRSEHDRGGDVRLVLRKDDRHPRGPAR